MGHHQTRTQRIAEVGALGYPSNISTTNYFALISILLALPPSLTPLRPFTNKEKNAIRRANILRKKTTKECHKKFTYQAR